MTVTIADTTSIDDAISSLRDELAPFYAQMAPINEKIQALRKEREEVLLAAVQQLNVEDLDTDEGFRFASDQGWTNRDAETHIRTVTRKWLQGKSKALNGGGAWQLLKDEEGKDTGEAIPSITIQLSSLPPSFEISDEFLDELADSIAFISPKLKLVSNGNEWSFRIADRVSTGGYKLTFADGIAQVKSRRYTEDVTVFTGTIRESVQYIYEHL